MQSINLKFMFVDLIQIIIIVCSLMELKANAP
jgi:hypothetical protein